MKPNKCCGKEPVFWEPTTSTKPDGSIEKIECPVCGRVIYCSDEDGVADWNNGLDDK